MSATTTVLAVPPDPVSPDPVPDVATSAHPAPAGMSRRHSWNLAATHFDAWVQQKVAGNLLRLESAGQVALAWTRALGGRGGVRRRL